MPKFTMINETDPLYVRRLSKVLNERGVNGFYQAGKRYNQARVTDDKLEVRMASGEWTSVPPTGFYDPYGHSVDADRTKYE